MKKVVHIIHSKAIGGVEVSVNEYYKYTPKAVDYYLFCIDPISNTFFIKGNNLFDFNGIHNPLTFIDIAQKILKIRPDVIVTSLWKSHLVGLFLKSFIYRQANYCGFLHSSTYFHVFDSFFSKLALKKFQYFIFDSKASFTFSKEVKTKKRLKNWIVPPVVMCMEKEPDSNNNFQVPYRFCFMGRLEKEKNLTYAINLIECLQNMGVDIVFDIYGLGKQQDEIGKLISDNSSINYCGFIAPEKVINTMTKYNFYIQCSSVEGFAISVVQALSAGLVCFITPVGEIASYTENGVNAVHLKAENFQQDADNILKYLNKGKQCQSISEQAALSINTMPKFTISFDQALQEMCFKSNTKQ